MAGPGNILITVGAETTSAIRELSHVNATLGDTMTTSEKMSAGLKKAALPAAAALTAIGYAGMKAAKAAMEDATAADHLAGVLKRTTGATDKAVASTEDWISATAIATGVSDDKLRPAIEKLSTATGDVTKAQKLANAALDIAAATGKDVDQVSTAVAKAYQGQTSALARLVPGLSEGARTSKDFEVIMAELADTTGGAAARAADTATGKYARMQVATSELQEELGYALLPILEAVIPVMLKLANFAQENTTAIKVLVGVVATLAAGILAANAAMKIFEAAQIAVKVATTAWTAAQWLLNAALNANPIGLIVTALAALAAGIYLAYTRSETFRDIVHGAMDAVRRAVEKLVDTFQDLFAAAKAAFDWIVSHWKLALFAFGPIGAAIYAIATNWDTVRNAASEAAGAVTGAVDAIGDAFRRLASTISHAIDSALSWIDRLADAVSSVMGAVRGLIDLIGRIPDIPKLPSIPRPWSLPTPGLPAPAVRGRAAAPLAGAGGVTIQVFGAVDPEGTARAIRRILTAHDRRQGRRLY